MDSVDTGPLYDQSFDHTPPLVSQSIPGEDKDIEERRASIKMKG